MSNVRRTYAGAAVVLALLLAAGLPVRATPPRPMAALTAHAPISIVGNAGFNATNGVIGGSGTAADPYIIAGWTIDAPPSIGVQIRSTSAHAIVRDVAVTSAPVSGFYAYSVSNLTLQNVTALGGTGDGIRFESSHNDVVQMSTVTENHDGIILLNSGFVSVLGSNLSFNAGDGVTVSQSTAVLVQSNGFFYNAFARGYGLDVEGSTNVTLLRNRFTGNDIYLDGASAQEFDSHTIGADNLVSGLPVLYLANRAGAVLDGLELGELLLANSPHARVSNLTTTGGDVGIEVAYSSDVVLGPNLTLSNAALGLRVVSSSGVTFHDSAILETGEGARIESSQEVSVLRSRMSSPFSLALPDDAIAIVGSDRVNVSGNVLRHHRSGVSATSSGNVSVMGNLATQNTQGVALEGSQDLLVLGNVFSQESTGLRADHVTNATVAGNLFEGTATGANASFSSGLRVVHNAFLQNPSNAYDANGSANAWDGGYPTGGNFWWTYGGSDQCHGALQNTCTGPDGIGDTPYMFSVGAADRYPLMRAPVATDVPPEALFVVSSSIGSVLTSFRVSANLSSDYEDALSALQVRWDWEGNGTWTPWTAVKYAAHVFPLPGVYTIRLEVKDSANLVDEWADVVRVSPKPDNLPPSIVAVPPPSVNVGEPLVIEANITDASGVENATVFYRGVDGGPFRALRMQTEVNGTNFTATIPAQPHAGTIEYVIVANDTWANEARAPLTGFSNVAVVDPLVGFVFFVVVPVVILAAAAGFIVWWRRRRRGRTSAPSAPPTSEGPPGNP